MGWRKGKRDEKAQITKKRVKKKHGTAEKQTQTTKSPHDDKTDPVSIEQEAAEARRRGGRPVVVVVGAPTFHTRRTSPFPSLPRAERERAREER